MSFSKIETAELEWQQVDGIDIPVSKQFGDVYFSKDNGLLETRHVFLNGNDLSSRLAQLNEFDYFCVGETGFGTGLNILALWQLWQQVRPDNHSHLHAISVEKFPLSKADLIRALQAWPELQPLAQQLIEQYPLPIAGCHRLNFPKERFSLDLWLGDAQDVFPIIEKTHPVNAWFLDGFAPSCNPDMWQEQVLNEIIRLSDVGSSFASFSVAGVLKRGLKTHGITITRPRGFGHKREMLKAIWPQPENSTPQPPTDKTQAKQIAVIGAGIAGLSTAWAFAQRGHQVHIFEQSTPLSGASGNPLALLNPKLCPIQQSHEHLMTVSWQFALQHYAQFQAFRPLQINQIALKNADELLGLTDQYPAQLLKAKTPDELALTSSFPALSLNQAGAVSPHQLRDEILAHPNIELQIATIKAVQPQQGGVEIINNEEQNLGHFDHAIVCCARHSGQFFTQYPTLKPIRGQVSWLNNQAYALPKNQAYSYGGYCMQLDDQQLLLGASFCPNRDDDDVLAEDHQHNLQLLANIAPTYAQQLPSIQQWQGRASVRAQSADYFPLVGKINPETEIYTFAGLGSKGFLFAPLCAEILVALMLQQACPMPMTLLKKINPRRFRKQLRIS